MSGVAWCGFERGSRAGKQLCERGAEILNAPLRSHALLPISSTETFSDVIASKQGDSDTYLVLPVVEVDG